MFKIFFMRVGMYGTILLAMTVLCLVLLALGLSEAFVAMILLVGVVPFAIVGHFWAKSLEAKMALKYANMSAEANIQNTELTALVGFIDLVHRRFRAGAKRSASLRPGTLHSYYNLKWLSAAQLLALSGAMYERIELLRAFEAMSSQSAYAETEIAITRASHDDSVYRTLLLLDQDLLFAGPEATTGSLTTGAF